MICSPVVQKAFKEAKAMRLKAYAPYSKFLVGACFYMEGQFVSGANIENASFGATCCAERIALFKAILKWGKISPEFLVLIVDQETPAAPCGLCLQVMAEFCAPEMPIFLSSPSGIQKEYCFSDFLPHPFTDF